MEKDRGIPLNLNGYKAQFRRDPTTLTRMAEVMAELVGVQADER